MKYGIRKHKIGRAGFTLLEVLLAVFILVLTALMVCAVFPSAQISRIKAAHMSYAVNLARQTLEEKQSAGYASLIAGTSEIAVPADLPGAQMTTTITQYSTHIKKIEVTIAWSGYRRVGGTANLITLVADHG